MIDLSAARELLDFGARIGADPGGKRRAEEQLEGAVAIHNLLEQHRVAYLADEVGMGKTYVALGAMALFRHFDPEFRVLVIAPRENIQLKWMKELGNFCANILRYPDLRVKSMRGGPARPLVACGNLPSFVHEVSVDPRRDFFLRMTSFSMGLSRESEGWKAQRDQLRRELPWLADEAFDLRSKEKFKDNYARAVCCGIPAFDLVIVDEGHNLKHGFREGVAARNRMMALAMGRDSQTDSRLFPGYGKRARRVLFLSATPVEDTYEHLWNQLDVFGLGGEHLALKRRDALEEEKRAVISRFLVRRVTAMQVHDAELTKNQYRREWRQGGVAVHDEAIRVTDPRKRLVVALVQKKVAELLGSEKFNVSFQIGMLASFESFLQTTKLFRDEETGNFDDPEQTRELDEPIKEGIDVREVNRMARDHLSRFGEHLPHPKMDEIVESLATAWRTGKKALIFVRRVASVKELEERLNEHYDRWLIARVRHGLPEAVRSRFDAVVARYRAEKSEFMDARAARASQPLLGREGVEADRGGLDTFFAWYFRGEGPPRVVSGARLAQRFHETGSSFRTFFERNHVSEILGVEPAAAATSLSQVLGLPPTELADLLARRAMAYLGPKKIQVYDRFVAAQAAALELLAGSEGRHSAAARLVYEQVYRGETKKPSATRPVDVMDDLSQRTFFTEILRPEWAALRDVLWPEPKVEAPLARFREAEIRAVLLAAAARLGHGLIDLYLLTIARIGSLELRQQDSDDEGVDLRVRRIADYLELLESQRATPVEERDWAAFDELREIAVNFDLILDVNAPDARTIPLGDVARLFGTMLGQQQPIGGMFGGLSKRAVQQFRMPGYPFVLVTTDILQEGEDLHTFCSSIHHYGISWTPSSMEQRIGRIDRVRSQTDRRLSALERAPAGVDLLQVHFPFLQDTVEVLQVERVLERMNVFLRLMHEGLLTEVRAAKQIVVKESLARGRRPVEQITQRLESAFRIRKELVKGDVRKLAVTPELTRTTARRLELLRNTLETPLSVEWSPSHLEGQLLGTMKLRSGRIQPFTLLLDSLEGRLLLRCISPVGVVDWKALSDEIAKSVESKSARLGAVKDRDQVSYNLTVQEDVLLAEPEHDAARAALLLARVAEEADRLEQVHLPGLDQLLDQFRAGLVGEGVPST